MSYKLLVNKEDRVMLPATYGSSGSGNYFIEQHEWDWIDCRESLHSYDINNYLYFTTNKKNIYCPIRLITYIEEILKLGQKSRIKFVLYRNRDNILGIENIKAWWGKNKLRYSLLTILLRVAIGDHPDSYGKKRQYFRTRRDFNKVVSSSEYLKDTKTAFKKFLAGYTNWKGNFNGWVDTFTEEEDFDFDENDNYVAVWDIPSDVDRMKK